MDECFTIRAAGIDFCAQQRGLRPRAVFLHGFGSDLHTWDGIWPELGTAFSALRYDLRGFGRSLCRDEKPFRHADDLLAILESTGIGQVDLVGVSMGGGIALNFALDHPARVRKLVLISPGLVAWEWSEEWQALWRPIVERARAGAMDEARQLWWRHPLFESTRHSVAGEALYASIMRFSGRQWVRDPQRPALPDVDRLHLLETRTLLLTGGRDLADFRLMADLLEGAAGHLQRIDDQQCGHLLHLEDPRGCALRIGRFLDGGGAGNR